MATWSESDQGNGVSEEDSESFVEIGLEGSAMSPGGTGGGEITLVTTSSSMVTLTDGAFRTVIMEGVRMFHPGEGVPFCESTEVVCRSGGPFGLSSGSGETPLVTLSDSSAESDRCLSPSGRREQVEVACSLTVPGIEARSDLDQVVGSSSEGGFPSPDETEVFRGIGQREGIMLSPLSNVSVAMEGDTGEEPVGSGMPVPPGVPRAPVVTGTGSESSGVGGIVPPPVVDLDAQRQVREELEVWREEQGRMVWFRRTAGIDPTLYLNGVAAVVGKANIAYINTSVRTQIQVYTRRAAFAEKLLDRGILIGTAWYKAYRGAEKPLKVVVEGVPPCVPNKVIAAALGVIGVCTPTDIEAVPYASRDPALQHVGACKRVGWVRTVGDVVVPDTISFSFAGMDFRPEIHTGQPKCFKCAAVGHVRRDCPQGKVDKVSGRPLSMAEVVAGKGSVRAPSGPSSEQSRPGVKAAWTAYDPSQVTPAEIAQCRLIESWGSGPQMEGVTSVMGSSPVRTASAEVGARGLNLLPPCSSPPLLKSPPVVLGRKAGGPAGYRGTVDNPLTRRVRALVESLGVEGVTKEAGGIFVGSRPASSPSSDSEGWSVPIKLSKSKAVKPSGLPIGGGGVASGVGAGGNQSGGLPVPPSSPVKKRDAPLPQRARPKKAGMSKNSNALDMVSLTSAYNKAMLACGRTGPFAESSRGSYSHVTASRLGREEAQYIADSPQYPRLNEFIEFLASSSGALPMDESGGSRKRPGGPVVDNGTAKVGVREGKVGGGPSLPGKVLELVTEVRTTAHRRSRRRKTPPAQT